MELTAPCIPLIRTATEDKVDKSSLLNSSKQPQAPDRARPIKMRAIDSTSSA